MSGEYEYFSQRIASKNKYAISGLKLRAALGIVFVRRKLEMEALPEDERGRLPTIVELLNNTLKKIDMARWPTVYISEVLDKESMQYEEIVDVFSSLRIKTFLRFCNSQLPVVKARFERRGIELPAYLEEVHIEYRSQKQG